MEVNIKLIGPEIRAKKGEVVTLHAEFATPCWSCIHERRSKNGYFFLNEQQGNSEHVYNATIHDDTTHFIFSIGDEGEPDLAMTNDIGQLWCPVTVTDDVKPKPTPEPDKKDLGKYLFKVGLLNDPHICVDNDKNTPSDSDDWGDEKDFKAVMDIFTQDTEVKFIASCGDTLECGSPKLATPEDDYNDFFELYNVPYWQVAGLRFFSAVGNHDYYGMFESRKGDIILPDRFTNYNSISGSNQGVLERIGKISIGGQGINGIVPARGRIVFDTTNGKIPTSGQVDMNFMSYNAYVEMYKDAAGFTGSIAPTENRFSNEAFNCMKNYVYANWDLCKDNLSSWQDGYVGMRNGYSKLNYYLKKGDNIFIFLSLDYGSDVWPINDVWHDRMIHARTLINLNVDDPYIRRMKEYVDGTGYGKTDEPYNYQYYSPNSLIWLKEIIENNTDKKIFIFTHHFLPNRVGNSVGIPMEGVWQYASVHPYDEKDAKEGGIYALGSNSLTGIEFFFFNKLLNTYKNVIMFSGHSHISWAAGGNIDNHFYPFVNAGMKNEYVYTKATETPDNESAWTISVPSTSKPRMITNGQSVRRYQDAEMGVMEIYEKGVKIKGYRVRKDNKNVMELLVEKEIPLLC